VSRCTTDTIADSSITHTFAIFKWGCISQISFSKVSPDLPPRVLVFYRHTMYWISIMYQRVTKRSVKEKSVRGSPLVVQTFFIEFYAFILCDYKDPIQIENYIFFFPLTLSFKLNCVKVTRNVFRCKISLVSTYTYIIYTMDIQVK